MNPTLAILIGAFLFVFIVFGLVMKCRGSGSSNDGGYIPGVTDGSIPGDHHSRSDGHGHHGDSGGHFDGGGHGGFSAGGGGGAHSAH